MTTQGETYVIDNYGKKSTFASFLPGISGIRGIPVWCYYVNRGQGVVSFGVDNKDHAIMEYYPAHQAYQNVKTTGFRTFIKYNGTVREAFSDEKLPHTMEIAMNGLTLQEKDAATGLCTRVSYYTLPEEPIGALVRKVVFHNATEKPVEIEVLDGMPALVPYGVSIDNLKNMTQTAKAWMQVEDVEKRKPYFRVRASIEDSTTVEEILGGNFSAGFLADGTPLQPIVDPTVVFSYDTSLHEAVGFEEKSIEELERQEQIVMNQMPCSFYGARFVIPAKGSASLYELIGQVEKKEILHRFLEEKRDAAYFEEKKQRADQLLQELCQNIETRTASPEFDAYCKYTYMDNLLRGGYPIRLGNNKIFYVYSRKHGDLERDYNYFSMLPEYYSQGNGNFRDVNQNRRCDTFFTPFVGRSNIKKFYSLIQLDGYNPLGIEKSTYRLGKEQAEALFQKEGETESLRAYVQKPFTPGSFYRKLTESVAPEQVEGLFTEVMDAAQTLDNGNFLEGYWTDHWTYNLDLIEEYLEVFPEEERDMLYEKDYTTYVSQININHREKRYVITDRGLRQYHALAEESRRSTEEKLVKTQGQTPEVLKMTLLEKLVLLCVTKFAALDAYGMGIEMEGGKPGWYDALNGMPALFGSSMAETYELARMLTYTVGALKKYPGDLHLLNELTLFMQQLERINLSCKEAIHGCETRDRKSAGEVVEHGEILDFWNQINDAKEEYRDKVYEGVTGRKITVSSERAVEILEEFLDTIRCGIEKALILGGGICPTYFTYEVPRYEKTEEGIRPLQFVVQMVPQFLEGPVRYLKLDEDKEKKRELYYQVKESDLYDEPLSMYKVNASLQQASYELGRARAFTPGWLENESIWLHMEYKYLLVLLQQGMYEEFFEDFHKAAVPFLDPEVYGRSIYENSSFIASSKNPNKAYHGKGFVARLSGSTIEFISMWKRMLFGGQLFGLQDGKLTFSPKPAIPAYLIQEDGRVTARLFGTIKVTYQFPQVRDYIPGQYRITAMEFQYQNGRVANVAGACAGEKLARDVRDGMVQEIYIEVE